MIGAPGTFPAKAAHTNTSGKEFDRTWPEFISRAVLMEVERRERLYNEGHIRRLLDKGGTRQERDWYAAAAVEYGWSRNALMNMMMSKNLERTGAATRAISNNLLRRIRS